MQPHQLPTTPTASAARRQIVWTWPSGRMTSNRLVTHKKTVTVWQRRHKLWAGVVMTRFAPPPNPIPLPTHSPPPSSRWLRAEWRAAVGSDAVDASGQSVTAEHSGLHSLLSHPVTVSGRRKAEMSLNYSEYHQRNNKTPPSFLNFMT